MAARVEANGLLSSTPPSTKCVLSGEKESSAPPVIGVRVEKRVPLRAVERRLRDGRGVVGDRHWREGAGERRGGAGAERQGVVPTRRQLVQRRIATIVHELHHVAVGPVQHPRRIIGRDVHVVAEEVGDRDVQLEALVGAEQRLDTGDDRRSVGAHVAAARRGASARSASRRAPVCARAASRGGGATSSTSASSPGP